MADGETDPVVTFRSRLQDLYVQVRRPTYRSLETHADHDGRALRTSTASDLLNGPGTPRWDTVETFVRACARYAQAHQTQLAAELFDLDRWHAAYRDMENTLADQAARREQVAGGPVPTRRRRLAIPAQLPPDVSTFTGRDHHLAVLHKLLPSREDPGDTHHTTTAVVISAIDGTAGVGKTALAVHWAHQIRDRFPDGQLYVNMRGFDPGSQSMDPATAVRGFLDALDVPPQRIPTDLDAQAALYRSLLVGRRVLIVADNARDTAQVRPLLPGAPGCLVLVTSRNQLTSLIAAHAAHPLTLDLLTPDEAQQLLAHRLGTDRVAAEPHAVDEIITACARLPLALALVAAHAAVRPQTPLHTLAEQLRDTQHRWHILTGDDPTTDVQAVFSWSYQALTPPAAQLFRLLGLHPGPDIGVPAAASLTALPVDEARSLLDQLARANLLTEHSPGRYSLHDLLRAYATQMARTTDTDGERHAATHRILDHYLHTAYTADRLLIPGRDSIILAPPQPDANPQHLTDHAQALAWFTAEHPVLLAAVDHAAATSFDTHTGQLAWALWTFLDRRGRPPSAAPQWPPPGGWPTRPRRLAPTATSPPPTSCWAVSTTPTPSSATPSPLPPGPATRSGRPTPTSTWLTCGSGGAISRRPSTTPATPSTCTGPPATRPGRPTPSIMSAGTRPCSATTNRPSPPASRPSPCCRNSMTTSDRQAPGTASATPTTTSATTPTPSAATSTPSTCAATSANATTKPPL